MIGVITYPGNDATELVQVLERLNAGPIVTNSADELEQCEGVILTGYKNAAYSMDELRSNDLDAWLTSTRKPVLAICMGMHLLYETICDPDAAPEIRNSGQVNGEVAKNGEVATTGATAPIVPEQFKGLGLMPGTLKKFHPDDAKIPHMGWKRLEFHGRHPLTKGLNRKQFLYYIHDEYAIRNEYTLATSCYIKDFAAIVARDNVMGTQFHPEKSGAAGSHILQNFLEIAKRVRIPAGDE
jgi:glutamine amidotransferase